MPRDFGPNRYALAALAFTALALAVFRPTPSELAHTLPAFRGSSADALLLVWATSHVSQTLFSAPRQLFDAGIFHPIPNTLALGDHMIGQALLGLPVWWATHNPLLEFNLLSLSSYVAGALAMYVYTTNVVGGGVVPALVAGIVFAFTPYRYHSPLWLQLLWTAFAPLLLLAWWRFVATRRVGPWCAWVGLWCAHSLCGEYLMLYMALLMGVLGGFALVASPGRRDPRLWIGTIAAPLVVGIALFPTWYPYVALRAAQGTMRAGGLDTPLAFIFPGPGTLMGGVREASIALGPGVVAVLLCLAGLIVGRRGVAPRFELPAAFVHATHALGLLATAALLFVPMQWQQRLPGLDMVRNTNRVLFVGLLFVAALVATAVHGVVKTRGRGWWVAVALLLLALVDTGTPPRERRRIPLGPELSPAVQRLAALPPGGVVYEVANAQDELTRAMYHAIFHRQRLPEGYSGFDPAGGIFTTHRLATFPQASAIRLLRQLDVQFVLARAAVGVAADQLIARATAQGARLDAQLGDELLFDVRTLPPAASVPTAAPLPRAHWSVAVSSGAETRAALIDGDTQHAWSAPPLTDVAPSITIDLGERRAISGVRLIVPRERVAGGFESVIALSDDGQQWTPVDDVFEPDDVSRLLLTPPPMVPFSLRLPAATTRFVRVTNPPLAANQQLIATLLASAKEQGLTLWLPWVGSWEVAEVEVLGR